MGGLENIVVNNIVATNTGNGIFIRLGHRNRDERYGVLRNVSIKNVKVEIPFDRPDKNYDLRGPELPFFHNPFPCFITGIEGHTVENVSLENIEISFPGRGNDGLAILGIGKVRLLTTANGQPKRFIDPKIPVWKIDFPEGLLTSSTVALKIEQIAGYFGGATIPEPVLFECSKGKIELENLNENESLKTYSGGMWYRKTINIATERCTAKKIILDLGKVISSAEVFINGNSIGSKVSSPWKFDLTGKLKPGENLIEIQVYNTLGNHYLTTPSMYIGRTNSGLIGPEKVNFESELKK